MTIRNVPIDIKKIAKLLIFCFISVFVIIILYYFVVDGVDWPGFLEFLVSCLLLIFLVEKINIKVPGLFEIKAELGEIRKNLSVVAQNISNVKISNKNIISATPTIYEGPPVNSDLTVSTMSTGTTVDLTQNEDGDFEQIIKHNN